MTQTYKTEMNDIQTRKEVVSPLSKEEVEDAGEDSEFVYPTSYVSLLKQIIKMVRKRTGGKA